MGKELFRPVADRNNRKGSYNDKMNTPSLWYIERSAAAIIFTLAHTQ